MDLNTEEDFPPSNDSEDQSEMQSFSPSSNSTSYHSGAKITLWRSFCQLHEDLQYIRKLEGILCSRCYEQRSLMDNQGIQLTTYEMELSHVLKRFDSLLKELRFVLLNTQSNMDENHRSITTRTVACYTNGSSLVSHSPSTLSSDEQNAQIFTENIKTSSTATAGAVAAAYHHHHHNHHNSCDFLPSVVNSTVNNSMKSSLLFENNFKTDFVEDSDNDEDDSADERGDEPSWMDNKLTIALDEQDSSGGEDDDDDDGPGGGSTEDKSDITMPCTTERSDNNSKSNTINIIDSNQVNSQLLAAAASYKLNLPSSSSALHFSSSTQDNNNIHTSNITNNNSSSPSSLSLLPSTSLSLLSKQMHSTTITTTTTAINNIKVSTSSSSPVIVDHPNLLPTTVGQQQQLPDNVDTNEVAMLVRQTLSNHNIGQRLFAKHVLNLSQGTVSDMLSRPKTWNRLTLKNQESFLKMLHWVNDPVEIAKLEALVPKKNRTFSSPTVPPSSTVGLAQQKDDLVTVTRIQSILNEAQREMNALQQRKFNQEGIEILGGNKSSTFSLHSIAPSNGGKDRDTPRTNYHLPQLAPKPLNSSSSSLSQVNQQHSIATDETISRKSLIDKNVLNESSTSTILPSSAALSSAVETVMANIRQLTEQMSNHKTTPTANLRESLVEGSSNCFIRFPPSHSPSSSQPGRPSSVSSSSTKGGGGGGGCGTLTAHRDGGINHPRGGQQHVRTSKSTTSFHSGTTESNEIINTAELVAEVKDALSQYAISQRMFGDIILGLSQGSVSDLLSRPKPWSGLTTKGREPFLRMRAFLNGLRELEMDESGTTTTTTCNNESSIVTKTDLATLPTAELLHKLSEKLQQSYHSDARAHFISSKRIKTSFSSPKVTSPNNILSSIQQQHNDSFGDTIHSRPDVMITTMKQLTENMNSDKNLGNAATTTTATATYLQPWLNRKHTHDPCAALCVDELIVGVLKQYASLNQPNSVEINVSENVIEDLCKVSRCVNTPLLLTTVKQTLLLKSIGQRLFGRKILGLSQGSVSELLCRGRSWDQLSIKGREPFIRLLLWLHSPEKVNQLSLLQASLRSAGRNGIGHSHSVASPANATLSTTFNDDNNSGGVNLTTATNNNTAAASAASVPLVGDEADNLFSQDMTKLSQLPSHFITQQDGGTSSSSPPPPPLAQQTPSSFSSTATISASNLTDLIKLIQQQQQQQNVQHESVVNAAAVVAAAPSTQSVPPIAFSSPVHQINSIAPTTTTTANSSSTIPFLSSTVNAQHVLDDNVNSISSGNSSTTTTSNNTNTTASIEEKPSVNINDLVNQVSSALNSAIASTTGVSNNNVMLQRLTPNLNSSSDMTVINDSLLQRSGGEFLDDSCLSESYSSPAKRSRVVFSNYQRQELTSMFRRNPYPKPSEVDELCARLNLSKKSISNWFHNHRVRSKGYPSTGYKTKVASPISMPFSTTSPSCIAPQPSSENVTVSSSPPPLLLPPSFTADHNRTAAAATTILTKTFHLLSSNNQLKMEPILLDESNQETHIENENGSLNHHHHHYEDVANVDANHSIGSIGNMTTSRKRKASNPVRVVLPKAETSDP